MGLSYRQYSMGSWSYEQTNIGYYLVTELIGLLSVKIAAKKPSTATCAENVALIDTLSRVNPWPNEKRFMV